MKKILPLSKPDIIHSPQDTYLFAILDNYPESKEWIMMNFINIQMYKPDGTDNFFPKWGWKYCSCIEASETTYSECLKNWINFMDFCEHCIDRGRYISLMLNVRYISLYKKEDNYEHNPMIYGYDDEKEEVYIADFFQNGIFSLETCKYSEINKAFEKFVDVDGFATLGYLGYSAKITMLKHKNFHYMTDDKIHKKRYYKSQLMNFMEGTRHMQQESAIELETENCCYGIDCLDFAVENAFGTRRFHSLLYNWSKLWLERITFLISEGIIADNKEIVERSKELYTLSRINLYKYLKTEAMLHISEEIDISTIEADLNLSLINFKEQAYQFILKLMELL